MEGTLDIAVIGCGSAGPAAALYLKRSGHSVEVFERVPELGPVGAGFLLQPTGLDVLNELGLLQAALEKGTVVERLYCHTLRGRTILDLHYDELAPQLYGLGINRPVFLHTMVGALRDAGITLRLGVDVDAIDGGTLIAAGGQRHGPFDLIVVADGARSELRGLIGPRHRVRPYPWGALWMMAEDADNRFDGMLHQVVERARRMLGFLPSGMSVEGKRLVSLFWSLPVASVDRLRQVGVRVLTEEMLRLSPAEAAPLIETITDFDQLTLAAYQDVIMRPTWHRGRVLFIGDAAHATSPQLGQGVNLALCDARELARCIEAQSTVSAALDSYTRARQHHLRYYQWSSRWLTPFFQSGSLTLGWLRDLGFPIMGWMGPMRRLMTRTMCGTKRGLIRKSMPMPRLMLPGAP